MLARAVPSAEPPLAIGDGAIRFLALDRGHRAAGEALLDSAEWHLRERGAGRGRHLDPPSPTNMTAPTARSSGEP